MLDSEFFMCALYDHAGLLHHQYNYLFELYTEMGCHSFIV